MDRLSRQLEFIVEIDRLKTVFRRSYITDQSRHENSAEHSWHVSVMAMILSEHCPESIDTQRAIRMLLIHDIVEADAGDTGVYDTEGAKDKADREQKAAERLFGLLPADQAQDMRILWDEFEERKTPEARFARAIDRLIPLLHNYRTQGRTWKEDGITYEQVFNVNQIIRDGSPELWEHAVSIIDECVRKGYLPKGGGDKD